MEIVSYISRLAVELCFFAVMLLAPVPVVTADDGSAWNTGIGIGIEFPEEDEEIQQGIIIEARTGYNVTNNWSLEGSFAYLPFLNANRFDPPADSPQNMRFQLDDDTWGLRTAIDALYHFRQPSERKWDPFLAATAGVRYVSANLEDGQHFDPFSGVGFGLGYQVAGDWQVRGDYRFLVVGHDTEYNHRSLVSLGYHPIPQSEIGRVVEPEAPAAPESGLKPIYYDFDSSQLTPQARATLRGNAIWLRDNPDANVAVEGHCDERGTSEYNYALGERRARAAKEYLRSLGVQSERMEIITYGEDRPANPLSSERAWAENRRVVCVP